MTSVKISKRNVEKKAHYFLLFFTLQPCSSQYDAKCVNVCVCVNSCLLSCFPSCLLCSGVRYHSLLHLPNVSQVSLCCSILVNLFDITLGAVTSTLLPALPVISIVPAVSLCCSIKHMQRAFYICRIQHSDKPGPIKNNTLPQS